MLIVSVFQDDKDLVHEFVNSDGLSALISVGQDADQNYQNYILRGREMTSQLFYCRIHPSMECRSYKSTRKFEDISNIIIAHPHQANKMCSSFTKKHKCFHQIVILATNVTKLDMNNLYANQKMSITY